MKTIIRGIILAAAGLSLFLIGTVCDGQSVEFVLSRVGNPGNAADATGYGNVPYDFDIGTYDVTLSQYAAFLNAVARKGDPFKLYNSSMAYSSTYAAISGYNNYRSGIVQTGSAASGFVYRVKGEALTPVTYVTWFDAARFCNWLQNGEPSNLGESPGSTETGVYTLYGDTTVGLETRNAGASWWLPSENEWYKAAYYDPELNSGAGGYWTYATQSKTAPGNLIGTGTNEANYFASGVYSATQSGDFNLIANYVTPAGSFSNSPGYYGTYDQAGDVYNWNEAILNTTSSISRGERGGAWYDVAAALQSSARGMGMAASASSGVGFRVGTTFSSETGMFAGLVGDSGLFDVNVARDGKFTGKLMLGGTSLAIGGTLTSGTFSGTFGKTPVAVSLGFAQSIDGDYLLSGTAAGIALTAYSAAYGGYRLAMERGAYTLLLSATDPGAGVPQGAGYATLTVTNTGGVTLGGSLPDGEGFTNTGFLVRGESGDEVLLYKSLTYPSVTVKGTEGLLVGGLTFEKAQGTSDLSGTVEWVKPAQSKGEYQAPLDTNLNVIGSVYVPPAKGECALPAFTSGTLALSDAGALATPLDQGVVNSKGTLVLTKPLMDQLKLTVNNSTGVFKGSFVYPGKRTVTDFTGVLFQDQGFGEGFFLGPDGSGTVELASP